MRPRTRNTGKLVLDSLIWPASDGRVFDLRVAVIFLMTYTCSVQLMCTVFELLRI